MSQANQQRHVSQQAQPSVVRSQVSTSRQWKKRASARLNVIVPLVSMVALDLPCLNWRALAGVQGVVGGQVLAIATSADDLYIGGDFASVAGVSASGLAICKHFRHAQDAEWLAVAALDGSVRFVILHALHTHPSHIHGFQKQIFTTKEFKQHHGIIWRQHLSCRRLFPCQRARSSWGQVSAHVTTKPAGKYLQSASVS